MGHRTNQLCEPTMLFCNNSLFINNSLGTIRKSGGHEAWTDLHKLYAPPPPPPQKKKGTNLSDDDISWVHSAIKRISTWSCSFKIANQKRHAAKRVKDTKQRLSAEDFTNFREGEYATKIRAKFDLLVDVET